MAAVPHPWLNDKITAPGKMLRELLANDSAPQFSDSPQDIIRRPSRKDSEFLFNFGGDPFRPIRSSDSFQDAG